MVEIVFETDNISRKEPDGVEISFVADRAGASLPFYCYEGSCETCRVLVVDGMENLEEVNDKERQTLGKKKISQGFRLGCQIKALSGRIVLKNGWDE
tara:strand:- start:4567 stop:4857 length:291 start_codon:yes stop_codon:yes gene_type:complete